jgi:predicted small secreted protein
LPSYGQSVTLQYVAWDTGANSPRPGDAANHTLRWVKDGASAAPANGASEVDPANAPGVYKVVMTATEAQCQVGTLCGKSSTANVVILPSTVSFENLPTASPAAAGGLPTVGTGSGQLNPSGGSMPVSGTVVLAAATHTGAVIPTVTAVTNGVTVGTNNDKTGYQLAATTHTGAVIPTVTAVTNGVTVTTNNDKTGYQLAATTHTGAIIPTVTSVSNAVTVGTNNDKTGYQLAATTHTGAVIPTVTAVTNTVTASVSDKTGFKLASDGLDTISTAAPAGPATNFRQMVVQTWRRFFMRTTKAATGNTIKTYADDGTTVITTQTWSDDNAGTQTMSAAS